MVDVLKNMYDMVLYTVSLSKVDSCFGGFINRTAVFDRYM